MRIDLPKEADIRQLYQLWKTVFGDSDDFLDRFFSAAFDPAMCLCAWKDTVLTGALYWLPCSRGSDRFAYVYAVATHPDYRGRGICRDLMEKAHARMALQGFSGALLYPQEEGLRGMYAKMGYRNAGAMEERIVHAAEAISMTSVPAEEYMRLRRNFLPHNSVIQEGPFSAMLAPDFRFYRAEEFLLTARKEEDHVFIPEFLGNEALIPGAIRSLGHNWGRVRLPGEQRPYAMFRPLIPGTEAPDYFAFALD